MQKNNGFKNYEKKSHKNMHDEVAIKTYSHYGYMVGVLIDPGDNWFKVTLK